MSLVLTYLTSWTLLIIVMTDASPPQQQSVSVLSCKSSASKMVLVTSSFLADGNERITLWKHRYQCRCWYLDSFVMCLICIFFLLLLFLLLMQPEFRIPSPQPPLWLRFWQVNQTLSYSLLVLAIFDAFLNKPFLDRKLLIAPYPWWSIPGRAFLLTDQTQC